MKSVIVRHAALIACMLAFTSHAAAAPQVIHKISTDKSVAQVVHSVEGSLPTTGIPYEYSLTETEALKKLFAKPQPHSALTSSKAAATQRLIDILKKRTAAIMRLVFNDPTGKHELHLAFKFGYESIGRTLVPGTTITITTTKALEPWQRELLSSVIKVDSMLVRNLLTAAGAIVGFGAGRLLSTPAKLRALRNEVAWISYFQEATAYAFTESVGFPEELYQGVVKTTPGKPYIPPLQKIYDSSWPVFDTSAINIPDDVAVAIIYLPSPGALSALAASGKLGGNTNKNQIRILVFPSAYAWEISSEISKNNTELTANNWLSCGVNTSSESPEIANMAAQNILAKMSEDQASKSQSRSLQSWDSEHVRYVSKLRSQHPDAIVRYLSHQSSDWTTLGTVATATTEITVLPLSFLTITQAVANDPSAITVTHEEFPDALSSVQRRTLLVINDQAAPLSKKGLSMRYACEALTSTKKRPVNTGEDPQFRFDDVFMNLQPTSKDPLACIRYIKVTPSMQAGILRHPASLHVFTAQSDTSSALETVYQAATAYLTKETRKPTLVLTAEEIEARQREDDAAYEDARQAAAEEQARKFQELSDRITWSTDTGIDEFEQFKADITAALAVIDPGIETRAAQTSPSARLKQAIQALPELAPSETTFSKHRLLFARREECNADGSREKQDTFLQTKGWQVVVWGKLDELSKDNPVIFTNLFTSMYPQATAFGTGIIIQSRSGVDLKVTPQTSILPYHYGIINVARAIVANRHFFEQKHDEETAHTRATGYVAPTPTEPASAGTRAGSARTPQPRREGPEASSSSTTERSKAQQVAEDILSVGVWCENSFQASEARSGKVFHAVINEWKRAHTLWIKNKTELTRTYVIFANTTDVFANIDDGKNDRFFVVTNYKAATELSHEVTVTQASGSSQMTLQKLKEILDQRAT